GGGGSELEALLTHASFYLAQVHGYLGDAAGSARYCAFTLRRQRQAGGGTGGGGVGASYEPAEWAKNAGFLADYHLGRNAFGKAARCLGAAMVVVEGRRAALTAAGLELLVEREAEVRRRFGRLYVMVMQVKHEEYMLRQQGPEGEAAAEALCATAATSDEIDAAVGDSADILGDSDSGGGDSSGSGGGGNGAAATAGAGSAGMVVAAPPLCDPAAIPLEFEAMRELFKLAVRHLEAAARHFVLDGYVTDYVRISQDVSRAYKHLAAFEVDDKRRQAMLCRRASALAPLLAQLGTQAYGDLHKELSFELGEVYAEMAELKLARIEAKEEEAALSKLNELLAKAVGHFEHFSGLFEGVGAHKLDPTMVGPYLRSHFHAARLSGKMPATGGAAVTGSAATLAALQRSLRGFSWIADNAARVLAESSAAPGEFAVELDLARQMAELLPTKIERFRRGEIG
ncbi:unnamed protein product, partial [Phaeothamnion confervicola]